MVAYEREREELSVSSVLSVMISTGPKKALTTQFKHCNGCYTGVEKAWGELQEVSGRDWTQRVQEWRTEQVG